MRTSPWVTSFKLTNDSFAYGGLNQANYVLSEIDNPRRNYKWPAFSAVAGVSVLYMAVNIVYVSPTSSSTTYLANRVVSQMLVVPFAYQVRTDPNLPKPDVASEFFRLTIGTISGNNNTVGPQTLDAFMAVSSLGNILVMTYTAARGTVALAL